MNEPDNDILKQFGFGDDDELRKALSELENLKVKPKLSKEDAWAKFEQSLVMRGNVKPKPEIISFGTVWKIAASVLLIISVWMGFRSWNSKSVVTANNQTIAITLPDGSNVTLNAASKLNYRKFLWKQSRKVELSGEALFKVNKGSSFEVIALGKTIRVLGTEFDVLSRENYFEVKCISGKVEVQIPGTEKVVLTKGTAIRKDHTDKVPVKQDITSNSGSWVNGNFYYNDADLNLVFDEISRQFNVHINKNELSRRYTGYFNKKSLTEALNNVCIPMNLTYSMIKDSVIIKQGL
jgi:transmembrane sensor